MPPRCITPARGPVCADLRASPSKSATHRALVVAALAEGTSTIASPLEADDTHRTLEGLRALGVRVTTHDGRWTVEGAAGLVAGGATIDLGPSGTSARLLTAVSSLGLAPSTLDGTPRLRGRPMRELVEALASLGARIDAAPGGTLPIRTGGGGVEGGAVVVPGERSSQFASALLAIAPALRRGLRLEVKAPRVSYPYVLMTIEMLEAFGARIARPGDGRFAVPSQRLRAAAIEIEGDHSSASTLLVATAILGGRLRIHGLRRSSLQPDARLLGDLATLGCVVAEEADGAIVLEADGSVPAFAWHLADAPDLAPAAAVLALFASGPCRLSGLDHLRFKESERLEMLATNLSKLGATVATGGGALSIAAPPRSVLRGAALDVASDHRIAMAFAVAGLVVPGVVIDEPDAVAKSYPAFWEDLDRLARTESSARG
jgi:3-phosphoshikimate 1-carboxyvinyltransferase